MTAVCSKCKEEKDVSEFGKRKDRKIGLCSWCKSCVGLYKIKLCNVYKEYWSIEENYNNKDWDNETKLCLKCKENKIIKLFYKNRSASDGLRNICVDCEKKKRDEDDSKKYRKIYGKLWREKNKEYNIFRIKEYKKNNREKVIKRLRTYYENRRKNDVLYKIRNLVSIRICMIIKKNGSSKSNSSILQYLPYSIQQLKEHLENQFEPWMNWENHGNYDLNRKTWQIDHIVPHSLFFYETMDCEEFRKCWALENLRPLETMKNMKKGNRTNDY